MNDQCSSHNNQLDFITLLFLSFHKTIQFHGEPVKANTESNTNTISSVFFLLDFFYFK